MSIEFILPRLALVGVVVIVLGVGGAGGAYFYLPQAVITVAPATQTREVQQVILLSTHVDSPDFQRAILPARVVEKTVEESKTVERAGTTVRDDFARGEVILHNEQDEEQSLLPKTHLKHEASGVFFLTDGPVKLNPKSSARATVTAKEKGARGNVPAGKFIIDKLPVSAQSVVYGESSLPFTGGVASDKPMTEEELTQAQQAVAQAAEGRARGELTSETKGAAIKPELTKITNEEASSSAVVGSPAVSFTVQQRVRVQAFVVDENDLLSLTLLRLRSDAQTKQTLTEYDPKSFSLSVERLDFERGEARVSGKLSGQFATNIEPTVLSPTNLAGRTEAEVVEYFQKFSSVGKVEVQLKPFWVKTVPARAGAVEILVTGV